MPVESVKSPLVKFYPLPSKEAPDGPEAPEDYYRAKEKFEHDQLVRLQQVQILREKLAMCSRREGPNRYENCKYIVEQVVAAQKAYKRGYMEPFRAPKFEA